MSPATYWFIVIRSYPTFTGDMDREVPTYRLSDRQEKRERCTRRSVLALYHLAPHGFGILRACPNTVVTAHYSMKSAQ